MILIRAAVKFQSFYAMRPSLDLPAHAAKKIPTVTDRVRKPQWLIQASMNAHRFLIAAKGARAVVEVARNLSHACPCLSQQGLVLALAAPDNGMGEVSLSLAEAIFSPRSVAFPAQRFRTAIQHCASTA
jgi:hypothetical protein